MSVYRKVRKEALSILRQEVEIALKSSEEYSKTHFSRPLLAAIKNNDIIQYTVTSDLNRVVVYIDMYTAAGELDDYISAVEEARNLVGYSHNDPQAASDFWKLIYDSANHIASGWKPKTSNQINVSGLYAKTMALRIANMETPAPFWYLLNYGNVNVPMGGVGGTPYPVNAPTNFLDKATNRIESLFNSEYKQEKSKVMKRLSEEAVNASEISQAISDALAGRSPRRFKPGKVIAEIERDGREYSIYVTSTRKFGIRQSSNLSRGR